MFGGLLMLRLKTVPGLVAVRSVAGDHQSRLRRIGAGRSRITLGMVIVVGLENLAGGMGTAAFVALAHGAMQCSVIPLPSLRCYRHLSAVGRVLVGPPAGEIVHLLRLGAVLHR
jgi:MFS transporter, PAT family, beta-lactamase induction signal transducer AmpG